MSSSGPLATALPALLLAAAGFVAGGAGSAWQTRSARVEPWRKLTVEHEGIEGTATHTRLVFPSPKLPLQAVDLARSPRGAPGLGHVVLRDGTELTVRFGEDGRPASLTAPDGSQALFTYKGEKARVTFLGPTGAAQGDKSLTVPAALLKPLKLARAPVRSETGIGEAWASVAKLLVGEAWAQQADEQVNVRRELALALDVALPNGKPSDAGDADVEVTCPPFTCAATSVTVPVPGQSTVRVEVSASKKRSELGAPPAASALGSFESTARAERSSAGKALPDLAASLAAVGLTAAACKSLKLAGPLCVDELNRAATSAGGAAQAVRDHVVDTSSQLIGARAEALYFEEQARAALDAPANVQLCLGRAGFARACSAFEARPLGASAPAPVALALALRRGIGGTLEGSYELSQGDGPDCKFSPSPRTGGPLSLSFDNERNTVTASFKATARGSRPNLSCSLGTANMSWSQSYTTTATQTFTPAELQGSGKLPLKLSGTMSGTGGYSFSNCRTSGGASAGCPGGQSGGYSYRVEILGEIDRDTQTGSGRIVVHDAQLPTQGSWRVPAEKAP